MPSFAWTTMPLGPANSVRYRDPLRPLEATVLAELRAAAVSPACPTDRRADVARWRRVARRAVVAECRRADARANLRRFVDLVAARTDWDNLTVVLTLADAATELAVSERTVTSMYAQLFQAGLLVERVPPRSATAGPDGRPRHQARVCRLWLPPDALPVRCEVCGTVGESVVPRPVPLHTACCDACWNWALAKTEEDAELVSDMEAAAEPADLATPPCGATQLLL